MIKVFPADDHELVRRGLFGLLAADPEWTVFRRPESRCRGPMWPWWM